MNAPADEAMFEQMPEKGMPKPRQKFTWQHGADFPSIQLRAWAETNLPIATYACRYFPDTNSFELRDGIGGQLVASWPVPSAGAPIMPRANPAIPLPETGIVVSQSPLIGGAES